MNSPLMLLHGWGHTAAVWEPFRHLLGAACLAPNLRPHADSLASWADDFAASIAPASTLIGWSLGAMLAMTLAARHPARVSRLVLIGATPKFAQGTHWQHGVDQATMHAFRASFLHSPARTQQRFIALQTLGDAHRSRVAHALNASLADIAADAPILNNGLRMLAEEDLRRHLPAPSMPCLLLHGEHDALMPLEAARHLSQGWPASQLHIIAGAAHAPFLSQPETVAQLIRDFTHVD